MIILALVGLAVVLIVNMMGPAISNAFADIVERAPLAPPELAGFTRVPPTPSATPDPNPVLTLTYTGGCTGVVQTNPNPPYTGGQSVTLTAVPDSGCTFTGWGDDLSGTENPTTITLNTHMSVSANFAQVRYTLTINITGAGNVQRVPDETTYLPGTLVQLTASPNTGYDFIQWSGDASGTGTTTNVVLNGDKTVNAIFEAGCYPLTLTAVPASGGAVVPNPSANCGGNYTHGTNVSLSAIPVAGYAFSGWSGDASGSANPYPNLAMSGNRSVIATFTQLEYTVTVNVSPAGAGTVTLSPAQPPYHYNDAVQLTANPATGYTFVNWSGSIPGSGNNPHSFLVDGNETITANFALTCYSLTLGQLPGGSGTVTANPTSSGGCPAGQYIPNTLITLTAAPAAGYTFQNWSGTIGGTNTPASFNIIGNSSVTANFQQCYALNVTNNPANGGAVSQNPAPNCGGAFYTPGTNVTLTANPNANYEFVNWSGSLSGSSNPAAITMNATANVTANFNNTASGVLFVVGNAGSLTTSETAIRNRLQAMGHTVTILDDNNVSGYNPNGMALIIVSVSVNTSTYGTAFRDTGIPLMLMRRQLAGNLRLGSSNSSNTNQQQLAIVAANSGHPLAAGKSGTVAVASSNMTLGSARNLGSGAVSIATITNNSSRFVIVGYPTGATMTSGAAPAARVGFFLENAAVYNTNGWALFEAAVTWAINN